MADDEIQVTEHAEQITAVVADTIASSTMVQFFDRSFPLVAQTITGQGAQIIGAGFALYRGAPTDTADLEVGFPTSTAIRPDAGVTPSVLPAARVATSAHIGGYASLSESWGRLFTWVQEHGHTPSGIFWEVYATDPTSTPEAELRTDLYLALA